MKYQVSMLLFSFSFFLFSSAMPTFDGLHKRCNQGPDCYLFCRDCCDKAAAKCRCTSHFELKALKNEDIV